MLTSLVLPAVCAGIAVFAASSIIWMFIGWVYALVQAFVLMAMWPEVV